MRLENPVYHPAHKESEQSYQAERIDKKRQGGRREVQTDEQTVARIQADLDGERALRRLYEEQAGWNSKPPLFEADEDSLLKNKPTTLSRNPHEERKNRRWWFLGKGGVGKRGEKAERNIGQETIRGRELKPSEEIAVEKEKLNLQEKAYDFCERFNAETITSAVSKNIDAALVFIMKKDEFVGIDDFENAVDIAENTVIETVGWDANYAQVLVSNYDDEVLPIKMKRLEEVLKIANATLEKRWGRLVA